ncbi:MAG: PP2C family protein-serine/threonine phosphatase [Fuerstiella sp.]
MPDVETAKMACMEVWGGNRSTWSHFVVPGLDLWVYSQPFGEADQGGDVYYVSSCASGRITRLLLGDVSGHGTEASPLARRLREIMRRNINYIDQTRLVESLNDQFEAASATGRFATAVISTYFAPSRTLTVCIAGHPPPLIFRASTGLWQPLQTDGKTDLRNMPIGVLDEQQFSSTQLTLSPGDMILEYTDALFEAFNKEGTLLKAEGIAALANSLNAESPGDFVPALLREIQNLDPRNLTSDDVSVMLARANEKGIPMKNNLLAPFRIIGGLFTGD